MSMVTVSTKRNRTYERKFDHDEARALYVAGASISGLAKRYGVAWAAVGRVVDPAVHAKMAKATNASLWRNQRKPCKGSCGRLVWTTGGNRKNGNKATGYCMDCSAKRRVQQDVRATELRCTCCREWKPDECFTYDGGRHGSRFRRNRHQQCKDCLAAKKRDYRKRTGRA